MYGDEVHIQHGLISVRSHDDAKPYSSCKYKINRLNSEISVFSNGLCIHASRYQNGGVSDIAIFHGSTSRHKNAPQKCEDDEHFQYSVPNKQDHQELWSIISDKFYQVRQHDVRAIIQIKKPVQRHLSAKEVSFNSQATSNKTIKERSLG